MLIGLIADTHGYLDPRVPPALKGVHLILHAGDIGAEGVLTVPRLFRRCTDRWCRGLDRRTLRRHARLHVIR